MKKLTTLIVLSVLLMTYFQPKAFGSTNAVSSNSWVETISFSAVVPTNAYSMLTTNNPSATNSSYYRLDIAFVRDTNEILRVVTADSISGPWIVNTNWSPNDQKPHSGGLHSGIWHTAWFKCDYTNYSGFFKPAILLK